MARQLRPRVLAVGFGIYFAIIAIASWQFAQSLPGPWYDAPITRWVYTTYMLVAAIFLVGLAGLGLSIRSSFSRQLREVDTRLGSVVRQSSREVLPPPLPETQPNTRDTVDRDIDELLESLSEVEATANREAQALDSNPGAGPRSYGGDEDDTKLGSKRQRLTARRKFLGRYLIGPGLVAGFILGLSGMMLPGANGFAQTNHHLNTALILGIGYSWVGVGWYVALTVYGLVGGAGAPRRR
ncbi:MAG: hypothetical protein E6J96_08040 [Methanobacteriota archaeon]|nr:MAG: hypothetical protein E6J96_08040 [Euryarchaeota archaeon]